MALTGSSTQSLLASTGTGQCWLFKKWRRLLLLYCAVQTRKSKCSQLGSRLMRGGRTEGTEWTNITLLTPHRQLCWVTSHCFTESSREAVNLIMSHWARLKAELIDQLLGEPGSERVPESLTGLPSPPPSSFIPSHAHLFPNAFSKQTFVGYVEASPLLLSHCFTQLSYFPVYLSSRLFFFCIPLCVCSCVGEGDHKSMFLLITPVLICV